MPEEWRKLGKYFRIKAGFGPAFFSRERFKEDINFCLNAKKVQSPARTYTKIGRL